MGYWAKDGSYVYDEEDIKLRERMNETQGQYHERTQKGLEDMKRYEQQEREKEQARREFEANAKWRDYEEQKEQARQISERYQQERTKEQERENIRRYGVEYDLRNPKSLEDRRSRANYWRIQNTWKAFVNVVNGKSKKFHELWDRYSKAKTEEERYEIVQQMEKMFPTKESAIQKVENQVRKGR